MPEESYQDKTEPATPRRREEARKKGEAAKSRELASIAVLSAGVLYLFFAGKYLSQDLAGLMERTFLEIPVFKSGDTNVVVYGLRCVREYLWMILPIMGVLCVIAVLVNYVQTGFLWSVEPLAPKASKIDPIQGIQRILSKRSLVEMGKSVAKILIVGWAAYSTLRDEFDHMVPLLYMDKVQIFTTLGETSLKVVLRCCWVIAILAVLDYLYQKWEFEQKMKMTKQEVKDEFKQTEGDPMVKSRIRSIQREMARRRMMEEVPKADVVITNPTHLAVALQYDAAAMGAPRVVAKGANKVAFRIRDVAQENHVPVIENRKLAQNLYKIPIGEEIPSEFYKAVAEILAYVYRIKKRTGIG
ncbi:MAG: flagellar biosynthesis protein FlhB [Deltaproteobacteria bacterium]|nr:flagellar biosynthesis protein FlhB [Deltaproteobacteria bacterium]